MPAIADKGIIQEAQGSARIGLPAYVSHRKNTAADLQRTIQALPKRASLALGLDIIGKMRIDLPDSECPSINALEHYFPLTR